MYSLLIVDDEEMIRTGIHKAISWEDAGIEEVWTAASALEALQLIQERRPDVLITDINMPEMNGLDFISKVRETEEHIHIIILTGYDRFDYVKRALQLKVDDFLLKPIDERELLRIVMQCISEIEKQRQSALMSDEGEGYNSLFRQFMLENYSEMLLRGEKPRSKDRDSFYETYGIEGNANRRYQAALILPHGRENVRNIGSNPMEYFYIQSICNSVLDQNGRGLTIGARGKRFVLFLFIDDEEEMRKCLHELEVLIRNETDYSPRIICGEPVDQFENIRISYNDAVRQLNAFGNNAGASGGIADNRHRLFRDAYYELRQELVQFYRDPERLRQILDYLGRASEAYQLSDREAATTFYEMASAVCMTAMEEGELQADMNELFQGLKNVSRAYLPEVTGKFLLKAAGIREPDVNEIIRDAKNFIRANLSSELSVARIAAELYISTNYFSRLFKRTTGEGCNEYIIRKRMEQARTYIATTSMKIGEVARAVGYKDVYYFSLTFKKYTGCSPSKYRALQWKAQE